MLLSEAIRLGATMRPQIKGEYLTAEGTCALGSALDALGAFSEDLLEAVADMHLRGYITVALSKRLFKEWPYVKEPVSDGRTFRLLDFIADLNDNGHRTREEIADYVERWERDHGIVDPAPVVVSEEEEVACLGV